MTHHDIRLPDFFMGFIYSSFSFEPIISTSYSARDFAKNGSDIPVHSYRISSARINKHQFEEFYSFYNSRKGVIDSFRLKDMKDYIACNEILEASDEAITEFKLFKTYVDREVVYRRNIDLPVIEKISLKRSGEDVAFDFIGERVVLRSALAPAEQLIINFEFDVKVRFISSKIEYSYCNDGSILLNDIIMREII